mmetsp:Transcript_33952/g.74678  ORF Transcript_33952/g.74678 Transcript_33952/m.74678 type:complete len:238 (+) Transcript_33952:55-768(+)
MRPTATATSILSAVAAVAAAVALSSSVSSVGAFVPISTTSTSTSTSTSPSQLPMSYLDSLDGGGSSAYNDSRNPYSDYQPGYRPTNSYRGGSDDAVQFGYGSEVRALTGNYYDMRGPNLGYDDDLKYVDTRGLDDGRPPVRRVTTASGWGQGGPRGAGRRPDGRRGGPPQTGIDMDRSPSTTAGYSWWDNAGQSGGYVESRGAQGGFSTYTDLQLYGRRHTPGYGDPYAHSTDPNAY